MATITWRRSLSALLVLCLSMLVGEASAASYHFVNIADTRGTFDSFEFFPQALSESGEVAFIAWDGTRVAAYLGSGGAVQQVAPNAAPAGFQLQGYYGLNASGAAVAKVTRCCPSETQIQLYDASGVRTLAEVFGGDGALGFPAINNNGAVAFPVYERFFEKPGITRWYQGTSTTVVSSTEDFHLIHGVGLNEVGDVAFAANTSFGEQYSYYRTDGTTRTLIADSSGALNIWGLNSPTAINDSGAVAFVAGLAAGGEGLFVGDGGPLTTVVIADETTPFYFIANEVALNNQGNVAFFAGLWDGRNGIFTGPDPVNDKLVAHGDILFGQFVTGLGRPHFNERGDIAFQYTVRDPREPSRERHGIALAVLQSPLPGDLNADGTVDAADYVHWRKTAGTPQDYNAWRTNFGATAADGAGSVGMTDASAAVPEPATLALLSLTLPLLFRRGRRCLTRC